MQSIVSNLLKNVFRTAHWLSLDVVLGAISLHLAFSRLPLGVAPQWTTTTSLLGLTVWVIYVLDRLLDNRNPEENQTKRHAFHLKYQFNLSLFIVLVAFISLVLLFTVPREVLHFGLIVLSFVFLYFVLIHYYLENKRTIFWTKTVGISIIYAVAVIGSIFVQQSSINLSGWLLACFVTLIAFQNLLLFAYFEHIPVQRLRKVIQYITTLILSSWIFFFYGSSTYTSFLAATLAGISVIYSLLPLFHAKLMKQENYRWVIDGLLILSLLALIF